MKRAEPSPASELPRAYWVGYHGSPVIMMSTVAALDVSAWYGVGAAVVLFAAQLGRWLTAEG